MVLVPIGANGIHIYLNQLAGKEQETRLTRIVLRRGLWILIKDLRKFISIIARFQRGRNGVDS